MQGYTRILSVGCDHHLLSTHSLLMRQAGFDVIEAYSSSDALRLAQSDAVDLVLLCQSIPKQEQNRLISAIHAHRRLMPVLRILANHFAVSAEDAPAAGSPPRLLLDAVEQAIVNYSLFRPNLAA